MSVLFLIILFLGSTCVRTHWYIVKKHKPHEIAQEEKMANAMKILGQLQLFDLEGRWPYNKCKKAFMYLTQ